MLSLFLFVVLVAVALGIIGVVVKGLLWLLVIGILLLVVDLVLLGARVRGQGRPPAR